MSTCHVASPGRGRSSSEEVLSSRMRGGPATKQIDSARCSMLSLFLLRLASASLYCGLVRSCCALARPDRLYTARLMLGRPHNAVYRATSMPSATVWLGIWGRLCMLEGICTSRLAAYLARLGNSFREAPKRFSASTNGPVAVSAQGHDDAFQT